MFFRGPVYDLLAFIQGKQEFVFVVISFFSVLVIVFVLNHTNALTP